MKKSVDRIRLCPIFIFRVRTAYSCFVDQKFKNQYSKTFKVLSFYRPWLDLWDHDGKAHSQRKVIEKYIFGTEFRLREGRDEHDG
jgi:hypothetical protein